MIIKAQQKFLRMSPRKLRLVAESIREVKSPVAALAYLENINKRASLPLIKVIKQAVMNAKNGFGLEESSLFIKELFIQGGASHKRGRPGAKGVFKPIKKRTSHITVVLESKVKTGESEEEERKDSSHESKSDESKKEKVEYGTKS